MKSWQKYLLYGGLAAGFLAGLAMTIVPEHLAHKFRKKQIEAFGTVDSPKYLASSGISNPSLLELNPIGEAVDNNDRIIQEWLELSSKEMSMMEDEYREISKNAGKEDASALESLCSLNSSRLMAKKIKISSLSMELTGSQLGISQLGLVLGKQDIKKDEPVEEIAKRAFFYATGKNFPSGISISPEEIKEEGTAGYHSDVRGMIAYEDLQYVSNLRVLLHEMGHVIAQHLETGIPFLERGSNSKINLEASIIEEACAYSFTDAASHALSKEDKEIAAVAKILNDYNMRQLQEKLYSDTSNESEEHCRGAELYIAARQVLKDPSKVFNYLASLKGSSLENLSPDIKAQIQQNRDCWKKKQSAEEQIRLLDGRAESLIELYDILSAQIAEYRKEKKEESIIDWEKAFSE